MLSLLVHNHILCTRPDIQVICQLGSETEEFDWLYWNGQRKTVIIIDEAQAPYDNARFRTSFVKTFADARFGSMIAFIRLILVPLPRVSEEKITPMGFAVE